MAAMAYSPCAGGAPLQWRVMHFLEPKSMRRRATGVARPQRKALKLAAGIEGTDHRLPDDLDAAHVDADRRQLLLGHVESRRRAVAPGVRCGAFATRPPLLRHVIHVGLVRAHEVMVRIDATPLVAAMAEHHSRRDRPVSRDPEKSMQELRLAEDRYPRIAAAIAYAFPDVAAGERIDPGLRREPRLERAALVRWLCRHARTIGRARCDHLLWAMAACIRGQSRGFSAFHCP